MIKITSTVLSDIKKLSTIPLWAWYTEIFAWGQVMFIHIYFIVNFDKSAKF